MMISADEQEMYRQLTVDRLNVAANAAMFHRFDNLSVFNGRILISY